MRLDDLYRTLRTTIDAGHVGVPVSLRIHLQTAEQGDWPDRLALLLEPLRMVLKPGSTRLYAQATAEGSELNLAITHERGPSALLTVGPATEQSTIRLLLIGNRGVARLAGEESLSLPPHYDRLEESWKDAISESLHSGRATQGEFS